MVGHMLLPHYVKYFNSTIKDEDILPASLSKEVLTNLLREKLSFNGMVVTDATAMIGYNVALPRSQAIPLSIDHVLNQAKMTLNDIDYVICHQANERIIKHVYKKYQCPQEKFYMNLQEYGNTSAASIPLALAEMNEKGILKKGMKIILVGFGGGLTWGALLMEW